MGWVSMYGTVRYCVVWCDHLGAASCRSFVVTEERACGACFKRIGTSAVVASPDGAQLQHYSCFKRGPQPFQLAPVTPYS